MAFRSRYPRSRIGKRSIKVVWHAPKDDRYASQDLIPDYYHAVFVSHCHTMRITHPVCGGLLRVGRI